MKYVVLLFSRIKQYYDSGKTVFIVFLVGNLILSISFIIIYGNSVSYMLSKDSADINFCKYRINLINTDTGTGNDKEIVYKVYENMSTWNIKDIIVRSTLTEKTGYERIIMKSSYMVLVVN